MIAANPAAGSSAIRLSAETPYPSQRDPLGLAEAVGRVPAGQPDQRATPWYMPSRNP